MEGERKEELPSSRQAISGHAQLVAKKDTCTT
jgi:hypothetical protein